MAEHSGTPESQQQSWQTFAEFADGDTFPFSKKKIRERLACGPSYIVFLGDDFHPEWAINPKSYGPLPKELGAISNRLSFLDASSKLRLAQNQIEPLRRMLGSSLARLIAEKDAHEANKILD